jgi:hypothetical protein
MTKARHCEGVRFHREVLEPYSPGFYADAKGAQYFCVSEFLLAYDLPTEMDFVRAVLAEVTEEFPGITVIEFAG